MTIIKNDIDQDAFSYDEIPYKSHPFPYCTPEHLRTIGMLFGMQPPEIEKARVLELGCSSGGNILRFTDIYPSSYTLGIDLSKVQIEQGKKIIKDLGFKNIELKHLSITEIDKSFGKFDYIICHGVFSWVPDSVREKIFAIIKNLLVPQGIAYVSYNTLPGWNMLKTIREMMLYHSSFFTNTKDKIQQARLFVKFMNDILQKSDGHFANFLKNISEQLLNREDYYLRHEYLEEENKAFYLFQFMEMAKSNGLSYLGDADLHQTFPANLPDKAAEKLLLITDIIRKEQYMDIILNRQFRKTLLIHNNIELKNMSFDTIDDFFIAGNIIPATLEKDTHLNNQAESVKFFYGKSSFITTSPSLKAISYTYADNIGNPLKGKEIIKLASKKIPLVSLEKINKAFTESIAQLIRQNIIHLFATKPMTTYEISSKPKISRLAQYQIKNSTLNNKYAITNQINQAMVLTFYEKIILEQLDGKNSLMQIKDRIFEKCISGELVLKNKNQIITDQDKLKTLIEEIIHTALYKFKTHYVLV